MDCLGREGRQLGYNSSSVSHTLCGIWQLSLSTYIPSVIDHLVLSLLPASMQKLIDLNGPETLE